ncbi:MAG: I78 family peptidase inhibitor [Alphaproteobacteria bacterium]
MSQDENKEKKAPGRHKVVLKPRQENKQVNPALWLAVIAVPLLFGLLVGLGRNGPVDPPVNPHELRSSASATSNTGRRGRVSVDNAAIAPLVRNPDARRSPADAQGASCDFSSWVGMKVEQGMLDALKDAKRPYRVLKPGDMMTMDHAPARVNFDLDNAGTITRVWCG